jgi:hypothetical protein
MNPEQLLDGVVDKETFLAFAWAMYHEAERGEALREENPEKYKYDDPLGWVHLSASGVLGHIIACIAEHPDDQPFTWKDAADFLYRAKIIE